MFVCATQRGICLLEFVDRRALETEFSDLQRRFDASIIAGENAHTRQAQQEITEYLPGGVNRSRWRLIPLAANSSERSGAIYSTLASVRRRIINRLRWISVNQRPRARWLLQTALTASRLSSPAIELSAKMVR